MRKLLESTAAQTIAKLQRVGAYVDSEVPSWRGGYLTAASVWLFMSAAVLARGHRMAQLTDFTRV